MGIGDWGLGIGDWGLGPIPNPPSPNPNPPNYRLLKKIKKNLKKKKKIKNVFLKNTYYTKKKGEAGGERQQV